jgi:hypothetical protein
MDRWLVAWMVCMAGCVAAAEKDGPSEASGDSGAGTDATSSAGDFTGSESASESGDPVGNCVEHPSVLSDTAAVGVTGMTAAELLEEVEGSYAGSITWFADAPTNYLGSTAPSPMTLTLTYDGGEIRSIDAELVTPCETDGPCPCEDSLEVDVIWRLVGEDGVLDETWVAPVIHQPGSWFMASALGIHHEFQPDETEGSLSAASFGLEDGAELQQLEARAELGSGAAQGSINAEVLWMDWAGFGPIANFAGVRAVDDAACNELDGEQACIASGCSAATGQRLYGVAPACDCSPTESFCFAAAPADDAPTTLYTRVVSDAYDQWDEVVALPMLADPPPPPWRACTDAPEIDACACFADQQPCG